MLTNFAISAIIEGVSLLGQTLFSVYIASEKCYDQRPVRPLRIEYPNAIYHVMARGNCRTDALRLGFASRKHPSVFPQR